MTETISRTQTLTQQLATYAAGLDGGALPPQVLAQAKWAVLDLLGVAIGGADLPFAQTVRGYLAELGGKPEATVIGCADRLPAPSAALVNAVCGHTLDMDDGHRYANGHPGVVTIPAALAAGEVADASGRDLLAAVVAGYEVFVRVATAINPAHLRRGFHTTGTVGPLAAAAAAGRVLGLDAARLAHALGIAAVQFGGLLIVLNDGAPLKPLHPGKAAAAGVLSAALAARGAEGPRAALEGADGYCTALAGVAPDERLAADLGQRFAIREIYFKLYAACRHTHPALDLALDLRLRHALRAAEIDAIHVATYAVADKLTGRTCAPETVSAAKFSLPFSLALAFARGSAGAAAYTPASLADEELRALARRVTIEVDAALDARYPGVRGAALTVHTTDGRVLRVSTELPRGEPELPATPDDLTAKFFDNAQPRLGRQRAQALYDGVQRLEAIGARDLAALLR